MDRADAEQPGRGHAWLRLRVILTGLVVCRGVVLLCVLPPFEAWDEYQHVGYIVSLLETGERPWLGRTDVPPSLLAKLPEFPHCRSALRQIGATGALGYAAYWERWDQNRPPAAAAAAPSARIALYQAQHGPLYYRLAAPLFALFGGVSDLRSSVGALRLANLLLTALSVWIAMATIARHVRHRGVAVFSSLLIATQPLFLINGVRVANDALGVLLATIAIAWAFRTPARRPVASAFGLGLLVGLAVLAKSVNFGLIPFVGLVWLWALARSWRFDRGWSAARPALVHGLALAAGFLVMTAPDFRVNWERHGSVSVMQEAIINRQAGRGLSDLFEAARSVSWATFVRDLWLRKSVMSGGWSWAGHNQRTQYRHEYLVIAGLIGWAWIVIPARRARLGPMFASPAIPWLCLVLCGGFTACLSYHAIQSQLSWDSPSTNPWYAAATYPWFLLLATAGAFTWPLGRLRLVLPVLLALFFLETEATIVLGSMLTTYTAGANWGDALRRLAALQPPLYGTATLYAAMGGTLVMASAALVESIQTIRMPRLNRPEPHPHLRRLPRTALERVRARAGRDQAGHFRADLP